MAYRRTYKKNVRRTRRPRRAVRRPVPATRRVSAVRAVVRKELVRQAEAKSIQYGTDVVFSTIDDPLWYSRGLLVATPGTLAGGNIPCGTQDAQRIGNSVRTKRLTFRGMFFPYFHDGTDNIFPKPLEIQLMLVKVKGTALLDDPVTVAGAAASSFHEANNSVTGLFGDLKDFVYPENKNLFTVLGTKRFKVGNAAYESTGGSTTDYFAANNDFKYNHLVSWDLTKYVDKKFIWNDIGATEPSNKKLYIFMQAIRADGTVTSSSTGYKACQCNFRFDYTYTDD